MMNLDHENQMNEQAFEEVNNILDDGPASEVDALNYKVIELQKIITTLTRTNERLIQRIEDLEDQLELKIDEDESTNFNQEYSVMQGNFSDVQELISSYKTELGRYQEKMTTKIATKDETITKLQGQVEELNLTNQKLKLKIDELQDQNERLSQTKESLISQIQELESSLRKSKVESPRYSTKYTDYSDYTGRYEGQYAIDFSMNVQAELQKLIQKLVKELQHERYLKKKLTEEIKQLQKDMLNQEKEIIAKNNKIYSLEITALKKNKSSPPAQQRYRFNQTASKQTPKGRQQRSRGGRDKEVLSKGRNFTLMELMNECTVLSSKEKLVIALKIIDLYTKKLQRNDFTCEILQSLTICNFNPLSSNLCQVKLNPNVEKDQQTQQDLTESSLVWNLIFILDNLLSQTATKDRPFGETNQEDMLLEAINYYLQNRDMNNVDSVLQVKKIAEEALSVEMR